MDAVIDIRDLKKIYADGTEAVKAISFQVQRGEFFGFLGPNGAGKSTTIKMLITLLAKSGGAATVLGFDTATQTEEIRRRIGYAAQETGVDDELTGRENLMLQGHLYHLPEPILKQRVDMLLDLMDLAKDANRPAGAYSGGMRKRLDLATGLIHKPEMLFLDEPTTGLDPQNRANLWQYLERLNKEDGLTIFLTTHYMEEADRLCDRLAIIDHGQIVALGSPAELKGSLGGDVITVNFKTNGQSNEELIGQAISVLKNLDGVNEVKAAAGESINVIVRDGGTVSPSVLLALNDANLHVTRFALSSPTLDDVFLKYTGRSIRNEELSTNWRSMRGGPFGMRRGGPGAGGRPRG